MTKTVEYNYVYVSIYTPALTCFTPYNYLSNPTIDVYAFYMMIFMPKFGRLKDMWV